MREAILALLLVIHVTIVAEEKPAKPELGAPTAPMTPLAADAETIGKWTVTTLSLDHQTAPPGPSAAPIWDADGKHFFAPDDHGLVSMVSVPDLVEVCRVKLDAKVTWIGLCSEGVIAIVDHSEWVVLGNPGLEVKKRGKFAKKVDYTLGRFASSPALPLLAVMPHGADDFEFYDIKKGVLAKTYGGPAWKKAAPNNYKDLGTFDACAFSRDGKNFYTSGGSLVRFRIQNADLTYEQASATYPTATVRAIIFSPDETQVTFETGMKAAIFKTTDLKKFQLAEWDADLSPQIDSAGKCLYSAGNSEIHRYDMTGKLQREYSLKFSWARLLVHPQGNAILVWDREHLYWCTLK